MRKKWKYYIDRMLTFALIGILLPLFVTIICQRMRLEEVIYGTYDAMTEAAEREGAGEADAAKIRQIILDEIATEPLAKVDYVEVVDWNTLEPVETVKEPVLVAMAVYIGKTRLIDNFITEK